VAGVMRNDVDWVDFNPEWYTKGRESVVQIDDPTGTVPVSGVVLDSALMAGEVGPNSWTFLWTRNAVSLDATRVTNDTLSILVFDLLQSGYSTVWRLGQSPDRGVASFLPIFLRFLRQEI
jgi:hypothetical protein